MSYTMNTYKNCPLKKRPVIYNGTEKHAWDMFNLPEVQEQPEDLSCKRRSEVLINKSMSPPKRQCVLDLSVSGDESSPTRRSPEYRPESPDSVDGENSINSGSSSSSSSSSDNLYTSAPPQIHLRGLNQLQMNAYEYQSAFVLAAGRYQVPVSIPPLWNAYPADVSSVYLSPASSVGSAPSAFSAYKEEQLTPPLSIDLEAEPENLTVRCDIPVPALQHIAPNSLDHHHHQQPSNIMRTERYKCLQCNKMYSTSIGLSKHEQFHCPAAKCNQEKKLHSCHECGKQYHTIGALKMHIRTHTLPCKCPICGKAFSRPWLLQGHIRTHTGEKPFQCPDCPRSFADRSNLRAHQQTHVEVKKYVCKTCNKSFSRMSLLNKHVSSNCAHIIA